MVQRDTMARTFTCICCRHILPANPRCKEQEYCGAASCQRERKRRWQARKMATDADSMKTTCAIILRPARRVARGCVVFSAIWKFGTLPNFNNREYDLAKTGIKWQ
jgi:hypothetical protein